MSLQVAILKVLASHADGHATLASLKRDIEVLSTSGPEWHARLKRLASRVPDIDIFSNGYVVREHQGWAITAEGREFLRMLEAVTQDNLAPAVVEVPPTGDHAATGGDDALTAIGRRFKSQPRLRDAVAVSLR